MSKHYDNFSMPNNLNNDNTFSINDSTNHSLSEHSSIASNHFNSSFLNSNDIINANPSNSGSKETGIIEKMLVSYGFIQCCERQARLFFHFSQYLGNTDHLKIGDPVEYEMSYDRRTGKPVAISIRKITSDDLMSKLIKTERVSGVIATEITNGRDGRVAFENMGEFFFLAFSQDDILDHVTPKAKDKVTFIIVTDDSGNYRAKDIQLDAANPQKFQGTISSIKDTFGFIDRSDNMSHIFFHSSDCPNFKSLLVGDYVEFTITSRKSKDLAVNVCKATNTVEEVSDSIYRGQVLRYGGRANYSTGVLVCVELNKELPFSDKDVKASFTLCAHDYVSFQLCTDRRTQTQRACNVQFLPESFNLNSETRERGYIASLRENYGFIKCPSKEGSLIYFKLAEVMDPNFSLKLNDEVEFTLINDAQSKKCQATRISILPNGTLFNFFAKEPTDNNNHPLIDFSTDIADCLPVNAGNMKPFRINGHGDSQSNNLWLSKKASFDFSDLLSNGYDKPMNGEQGEKSVGIIVAVKESYCFIESIDGETEYFGHQSGYLEDDFEMGQTVEFMPAFLNGKWKATDICKKQNVEKYEGELSDIYTGIVLRTIQMFNSEQAEYPGLLARTDPLQKLEMDISDASKIEEKYEFSMTSFKHLKDYISLGDVVKFQVGTTTGTKKKRAFNIEVIRDRIKGTILVISRLYGFIKPESDGENKSQKIYFNKSEVSGNARLKIGDPVEFYLVVNKKSEKSYAIDIVKMEEPAGERPVFKFTSNLNKEKETGPKVVVIRQPKAPDGTKGFNTRNEENGQ